MIGFGFWLGRSQRPVGNSAPSYATYDVAEDFKNQQYYIGGVKQSSLAAEPGYAAFPAPTFNSTGLVVTTSATLAATVNPITSDQDFIFWVVANYAAASGGTSEVLATFGSAGNVYFYRNPSGNVLTARLSAVADYPSLAILSGRFAFMYRRRGSKNTIAANVASTVTLGTESGITTLPAMDSTLNIGNYPGGGFGANATIEGLYIRKGTFTDADMAAILTAA